ncbi:hypothetical protein PPYR_12483 [Photinus pyralis]|uniref:Rho-GAP domain-containing protein n=1 Tax=Photinus pyralis TaxID=7054 RepID=A0A1Y1LLK8_PHOPY|nr:uncharacterized protein LOC116176343 [Photinus pyralis]KAB0795644.1 hypothetical protein PPYR_12483 [Photinus pyralis]
MGNRINRILHKQIISARSLTAVQEVVRFLKRHLHRRDIFHGAVNENRVRKITVELRRGGSGLSHLLRQGWVLESAAALHRFLRNLKKPLVPPHIQALALDENPGVSPEVVAQDVLGLVKQDVKGRQYHLVSSVLDFLYCVLKETPTDELTGCSVPITMIPIFFNIQTNDLRHWRRIATVFVEIIRMAPTELNLLTEETSSVEGLFVIPNEMNFTLRRIAVILRLRNVGSRFNHSYVRQQVYHRELGHYNI